MGASHARLSARARTPFAVDAFGEEGGFLTHPFVRPRTLEHRPYQLAIARGALSEPSLVVLPGGLGKSTVAALVAAERLRQAGGFVLILAPTRPRARHLKLACAAALSPSLRVGEVTPRTSRRVRREVFENAGVVVATPEPIADDLSAGRLDLSRCSLLVVDGADRTVGDFAYAEVSKALRRDRPGGLVLALTAPHAGDRRRTAAIMDALALRRLDLRTREDGDVKAYLAPQPLEVVEVELDGPLRAMQELLERELEPEVRTLARLAALPEVPAHLVGRRHLAAAGESLRRRRGRDRGEAFEGLKAHARAMLLVQALEICEAQGAGPLQEFLAGLGAGPYAPRAERALGASRAVQEVKALALAQAKSLHPKEAVAVALVLDLIRQRPGARALVFAETTGTGRALADAFSCGPPLGPGLSARALEAPRGPGSDGAAAEARQRETLRAFENGRVQVVVATRLAAGGLPVPDADLAVFLGASPLEVRAVQRRSRRGGRAPGRLVVLAVKGTRDIAAFEATDSGGGRARATPRLLNAKMGGSRGPAKLNHALPLEEPAAAAGAAEGGGKSQ
ncbi:MAG TPA: DEAD/DEAH box helicase [Candidatus Thermoplasmatota archaeon]|nr:DEAD/DEAH box helicase [Candidatus Thermoplasmatota archaeon]